MRILQNTYYGQFQHPSQRGFYTSSTNAAKLAGLANMTMLFEDTATDWYQDLDYDYEVAGEDLGAVLAGYEENFVLGTLEIGRTTVGQLRLVNLNDNQLDSSLAEALYVDTLIVGSGSELDLNGLNLYCRVAQIADGAVILNGTPTIVPEPTTLALLGTAGILVLRRHKA
jgi:hypothetical protein